RGRGGGGRHGDGRAGVDHGEARGGGGRARSRLPRRRVLVGRVRLLHVRRRQWRSRRAWGALRLDHQSQLRTPPGPESAYAPLQPGDRRGDRRRRAHRRRAAAHVGAALMQPFTTHTGIAVPLLNDDINTDQSAPAQPCGSASPGDKGLSFMRARRRHNGSEDPDLVRNQPQFRDPGILVTGHNCGAGSSREAAVWGMLANNIRVIVARSFADIYRENCLQNGLLPIVLEPRDAAAFADRVVAVNGAAPFTVDLRTQRITGPGGPDFTFHIPPPHPPPPPPPPPP